MKNRKSLSLLKFPLLENEKLHVIKQGEIINLFCATNDPYRDKKCKDLIWEYINKNINKFESITYYDFIRNTEFGEKKWLVEADIEREIFVEYNVYINSAAKPTQRLINDNINDYEKMYWLSLNIKDYG